MKPQAKITTSLEPTDVTSVREFAFDAVIDLRQDAYGNALPVDEQLLRRMRYQFVSYEQCPLQCIGANASDIRQLVEKIEMLGKKVLVVTPEFELMRQMLIVGGIDVYEEARRGIEVVSKKPEWTWQPVAVGAFR